MDYGMTANASQAMAGSTAQAYAKSDRPLGQLSNLLAEAQVIQQRLAAVSGRIHGSMNKLVGSPPPLPQSEATHGIQPNPQSIAHELSAVLRSMSETADMLISAADRLDSVL